MVDLKIIIILCLFLFLCFCIFLLLSFISPPRSTRKKLKVGDVAPDFALIDEIGNVHTLSGLHGHKVVLFFYPKDNTPGCTKEACNLKDNFVRLKDLDITILGLSSGSPKSKQQFKKQHNLPFPLLTANENTLQAYGTQGSLFTLYMPKRETFLINEQGKIVAIITQVNVSEHTQQIIDEFTQAQKSTQSSDIGSNNHAHS